MLQKMYEELETLHDQVEKAFEDALVIDDAPLADPAEVRRAMEYYAERFRSLFRELGDNVTNLGSQVGDVSQQVADWLRKRGGGSGSGGSGPDNGE